MGPGGQHHPEIAFVGALKWGGTRCTGMLWLSAMLPGGIGDLGGVDVVIPAPLHSPAAGKPVYVQFIPLELCSVGEVLFGICFL